ncbi:MAG: type IV pilus assembly protein PilM [Candidatus Sericytochromatia bacterium]|nr:type IV pilus assembly protein PilM [Candidatus Sericytochromatia bacterium]
MSILDTIKTLLKLKSKVVVGLDIGPDAIIVAGLSKSKAGYSLDALGTTPMPPNAFQDGEIVDSAAVGDAIRTLLDDNNIQSERAVVAISGQSVIIRLIQTDPMDEDELETFINYEAERYIPFALDDVNLSSQIVGTSMDDNGNEHMDVLLVAAQKNLVQSFISTADEAGLTLNVVDVASFAVTRALEKMDHLPDNQTVAALLIQGPSTDINVLAGGGPKFNRSVLIGYSYLVDNLINSLGIDETAARELLDQLDVDPQGYEDISAEVEQATEIIRPALSELTGEISRSLDFFMSQGGSTIDRIVICGRGAAIRGLDRFLTTRLGIEVLVANPFTALGLDDDDIEESQAPIFVTAVGLALRGLEGP